MGSQRARRLARELEASARSDPSLRPQAEEATIVARELESTSEELHRLRVLGSALEGGLGRLAGGGQAARKRHRAPRRRRREPGSGLGRLGAGADRLATGLGALEDGAGSLESGLAGGYRRSYPLQAGLRRAAASAAPLQREVAQLRRISPGFFRSGYLALAAIDGAPPARRALAEQAINVSRGGQAARLLVIPTAGFDTAGSREVGSRLLADAAALGRAGDMRTGVSGGAATLNDYAAATKARLPLVIGAIVAITFLMLLAILRAPLARRAHRRPQPALGRRGDRRRLADLQASRRLPAGRPPLHRHGRRRGDLRRHLRPLDRLCRVPAGPDAGALRGRGGQCRRDRLRAREDRRGDHRRRGDHGRRLHLLRHLAGRHREPDGGGADRRDPARRDRGADRPAARPDVAARRASLARATAT